MPAEDGLHSYDRLHHEYFKRSDSPLILEARPLQRELPPDAKYDAHLFNQEYIWLFAWLKSRLGRLSENDNRAIRNFIAHLVDVYEIPRLHNQLLNRTTLMVKMYPIVKSLIEKQISPRIETKFTIIQNASYLGRYAILTKILHELGYHVAEAQHGMIHAEHPAYNYPQSLSAASSHPASVYLPDDVLTFGNRWSDSIKSPSHCITIGYPYLIKSVDRLSNSDGSENNDILVISQWTVREKLVKAANALADAFPDRRIIFKLHPAEIQELETIAEQLTEPNIELVGTGNTYALISNASTIVGFNSTVLVEAAAFPHTRIFFGDQNLIPADIGAHFTSEEELVSLLSDLQAGYPAVPVNEYWEPDWPSKLSEYLTNVRENT